MGYQVLIRGTKVDPEIHVYRVGLLIHLGRIQQVSSVTRFLTSRYLGVPLEVRKGTMLVRTEPEVERTGETSRERQ